MARHSRHQIKAAGLDFPGLRPVPMRAGDVLVHDIRLVPGFHRSRGWRLRRTLYYEFQSLNWMEREGVRPGVDTRIDDTLAWARIRLTRHAIEARKACPYAAEETSFDYRGPPGSWSSRTPGRTPLCSEPS